MSAMNGYQGPVLRPMDFGELLDQTFQVYRRGFRPLITVGLIAALPSVVVSILSGLFVTDQIDSPDSPLFAAVLNAQYEDFRQLTSVVGVYLLLVVGSLLLSPLIQGAVIAICARTYLGKPTTAGQALRIALSRYPALLGTSLLKGFFLVLAGLVLVLAGLVFLAFLTVPLGLITLGVYLTFSYHAVVVERAGGGIPAMSRSFQLVNGRFWRLLGLGIVFTLMVAVVNWMVTYVSGLPSQFFPGQSMMAVFVVIAALLGGLASAIVTPFNMLGLTLAYYDTRMRKEGFDLEMLAQSQAGGHEEV